MIGFFDSGIGGLNYKNEFDQLSRHSTLYLAEQENLPFGNKTPQQIRNITISGVKNLFEKGCNLVILACNTASVRSIRYIQQEWLPRSPFHGTHNVLGISTPFLEYVLENIPRDESITVLGTQSTIESGFYQDFLAGMGYSHISYYSMPELAGLIEYQHPLGRIQSYLKNQIDSQNIDVSNTKHILLVCTHYHWIEDLIQNVFPYSKVHNHMQFTAQKLLEYIQNHPQFLD